MAGRPGRPAAGRPGRGAGTGANRRYLEPRLPFAQRWAAVDLDPAALAHPGHGDAERVVADVEEIGGVLDEVLGAREGAAAPVLVTCSALLDVLTTDQVAALADAIVRTRCGP